MNPSMLKPFGFSFAPLSIGAIPELYGFHQTDGGLSFSPGGGGSEEEITSNDTSATAATSQALKHDPGVTADWTAEEQAILEKMLREESTDSPMIRNSKIAMHLPKKTMRDVALRRKWMAINDIGKKRRGGSLSKRKDKKGRAVNSSARACCCPAARFSCPIYDALMRKYLNSLDYISCYETGGQTGELFRHNSQIFDRISQNIINLQINDNVDLFNQARENILSAMNELKDIPDEMKKMPRLPYKLNHQLFDDFIKKIRTER